MIQELSKQALRVASEPRAAIGRERAACACHDQFQGQGAYQNCGNDRSCRPHGGQGCTNAHAGSRTHYIAGR